MAAMDEGPLYIEFDLYADASWFGCPFHGCRGVRAVPLSKRLSGATPRIAFAPVPSTLLASLASTARVESLFVTK
jgi:hypothetical protein